MIHRCAGIALLRSGSGARSREGSDGVTEEETQREIGRTAMIRRAWRKRAVLHVVVGLLLLVPAGPSAGGVRLSYEDVVGEALNYSSRQSLSSLYPTLALNGRLERFNNLTRQDSIGTINGVVVGGLQDEWRSSVFVLGEYTLSNWYKKRYESGYSERLTEASLYETESEKKKIVLEITDVYGSITEGSIRLGYLDDYIDGGSGDDTVKGWRGNDTLIGGTDGDYLCGESGSDLYIFGRGHGRDTLQDLNETAGSTDIVRLDGIARSEVVFSRRNNDLRVLTSANDSIACKYNLLASYQYSSTQTGTFTDLSPGIERLETADGYTITRADIINIVNAMVAYNISDTMTMSAQYTNFMGNTDYQAMLAQGWQQITNPQT